MRFVLEAFDELGPPAVPDGALDSDTALRTLLSPRGRPQSHPSPKFLDDLVFA